MDVAPAMAPSPQNAVTSPRSLQTPPNLDNMTLTNEATAINGPVSLNNMRGLSDSMASPKHGSGGTLPTISSPGSSVGRSSSISPPGPALSLVSKSYPTSQSHGVHLSSAVNGVTTSHQLVRSCGGQGVLAGHHPSHQLHAPLGYHRSLHPASPPGIAADMTTNDCRLIDYRGAKVAAFLVHGDYLLCLPQAFELFLKHLVGGLHTVYTKLKRLDITPIVCNVEQVRILRGLGAIQPGVNRCKLLSCKDFDALYKDCTTARRCFSAGREIPHHELAAAAATSLYGPLDSSRPGRPPKRVSMVGIGSSGVVASSASLLAKKNRLDSEYHSYENGHISGERLEKAHLLQNGYGQQIPTSHVMSSALSPFMALNSHHGISSGSPSVTNANTMNHGLPPTSRIDSGRSHILSDSVASSNRSREERVDVSDTKERLYYDSSRTKDHYINGASAGNGQSPVLNLSQNSSRAIVSGGGGNGILSSHPVDQLSGSDGAYNDNVDDDDYTDDDDDRDQDFSDHPDVTSTANGGTNERIASQAPAQHLFPFVGGHLALDAGAMSPTHQVAISSIETLLRNIQGLLKVAADNARQQERQINIEKAELKMEVLRERELRETLEKQLLEEQRTRILYQKRLKKEKRSRRRFQEQLESEVKKRAQYEEALRTSSADTLRLLNDTLTQELERERNAEIQNENKPHGLDGSQSGNNRLEFHKNATSNHIFNRDCPMSV